jgi:hypothetical protein
MKSLTLSIAVTTGLSPVAGAASADPLSNGVLPIECILDQALPSVAGAVR